jgi:hypothetical protein
MTGAEAVHSHSRAMTFGVRAEKVGIAISKGLPEDIATFVTMLGSKGSAGRAMAEVACSARATIAGSSVDNIVAVAE